MAGCPFEQILLFYKKKTEFEKNFQPFIFEKK